MLNSLRNPMFADDTADESLGAGTAWRVWCIGAGFTLSAVMVLSRLAWVQTRLPEEYLAALSATTIEEELIPARDGRILSESAVLAADVERYSVQLHYRWLQLEPDAVWLKQQVRVRLSRDERRDANLVARTEEQLLAERAALLESLGEAATLSPTELRARCLRIEQRIRRISDSVNARAKSASQDEEPDHDDESPGVLMRWASALRDELTTPPRRDDDTRIIVAEEEAWHTVVDDVPFAVAGMISEHPERFPGVRIKSTMARVYSRPDIASHVVGARTIVTDDDRRRETSLPDDGRIGRFGVEHSYNDLLSGVPGLRRVERDRRQRVVSSEVVRRPVSGQDLTLTIDLELQAVAEQLLAESLGDAERSLLQATDPEAVDAEAAGPPEPEFIPSGGCALVMDAATGRLLVAASAPDFDLTMFTKGSTSQWAAMNGDTRRPFVPRFTGMALPPGSTWKILTAIAGLETGTMTAGASFHCQGFLSNPDEHRCLLYRLHGVGHGAVSLRTALAQSCNVYFFDAARSMGMTPLVQWSERMEFGRATGIDLPFEKTGTVPGSASAAGNESANELRRFEREALGMSIGQSRLTVTPLQMARLLAVVANGGWLVTPHVASEDGAARQVSEISMLPFRQSRHRVAGLSDATLATVRTGLRAAVEEPIGTGFKTVRVPGVAIAGKSGTAENAPGKPDHAWFAGYVPADKPQYVVVVVLEHGGSGSRAAGPVVRELVRAMQSQGLLGGAASEPVDAAELLTN